MFEARVKLTPIGMAAAPSGYVENADTFWRKLPSSSTSMSVDPLRNEEKLRVEFSKKLQSYLRDKRDFETLRPRLSEIPLSADDLGKSIEPALPSVVVRVRRIGYGSIEFFLEIFGLTGDAGRQFLLAALAQYAPLAFNETMGTNLQFAAEIALSETGGNMPEADAGTAKKTFLEKLGAQWLVANTSLLVPVGLALYVCYVAYTSLMHELDGLRTESKELRTERDGIVKALVEQNKNISLALIDHAKSSVANTKAIQDLVVELAKSKATGSGGDGQDGGKRERVTATGPGALSGWGTNYNICMVGPDAPKTYTAARFKAAVSKKTTMENLFASCPQIQR
ncbi:hypothetical protein IVB30_18605 [Bradyrhizobium sp. 200]|uniref:hypothetical protein n=1 Tax=Bradyrhizobium sp. 200 TaxID=2782665 RepID=UPI001FFEA4B2|nr:hypothetical protein [Bradyrhizobium sp. 200]UPJ53144.1 hypothetical protein IVB30_18605 [Bradyrhizobium sp. 200]